MTNPDKETPFSHSSYFSNLSIILTVLSLLFMLAVLFVAFLNPLFEVTESSRFDEPVLNLYIDTSSSMFIYKKQVRDFLDKTVKSWPGKINSRFFSYRLDSRKSDKEKVMEELEFKGFVASPTLFSPIQENLLFANSEHYYGVVSDFLFRDGFSEPSFKQKIGSSNIFFISPDTDFVKEHLTRSAVFIRNTDNHFLSDGSYPLQLLFYRDTPGDVRYRIYYKTSEMISKNQKQRVQLKSGTITINDHYVEEVVDLKFPGSGVKWLHLEVEIQGGTPFPDRINLLPPREKINIEIVYFRVNRDAFAIKNSLDRYRNYQTDLLNLIGKSSHKSVNSLAEVIQRLENLVSLRDLFILIAPPPQALEWFRNKKIPFIHYPEVLSQVNPGQLTKVSLDDLDFDFSPLDFMGERDLSLSKWQQALPHLIAHPVTLVTGDIPFHRFQDKSAFFIRGKEMYWGIKNLFFLNDNILQLTEESYWDIFLTKMIDFLNDRMKNKEKKEVSHNFFLGEATSDLSLPFLVKEGEVYHVSPELKKAGSYPSPKGLPPYNYRIPVEEYFPPPPPAIKLTGQDEFLEFIKSIKNQEIPQVVKEIPFRDTQTYTYLIGAMIALFLFLLFLKWMSSRLTSTQI